MKKAASVDHYIEALNHFQEEAKLLREICIEQDLIESIKWMFPTYSTAKKNIVSISATKQYCGLWFFQGSILADNYKLLYNAQEGKTKAMRSMRFKSTTEIDRNIISDYIQESILNFENGLEIKPERKSKKIVLPAELDSIFKVDNDLKIAFEKLAPFRQRGHAEYIDQAKRQSTRDKRLKECCQLIFEGKGPMDKYRK